MKKFTLFFLLLVLSSNISAQDAFEWDANEDTKDIIKFKYLMLITIIFFITTAQLLSLATKMAMEPSPQAT